MTSQQHSQESKVFYELCYDQYKFALTETDQIYQRVSFVLILLSLLGGVVFKLGRIDIFGLIFVRVEVFLFYLSTLTAILLLAASVCFAILFSLPRRRKYINLASMNEWQKWRQDYENYLKQKDKPEQTNTNSAVDSVDNAMLRAITLKLAEAQAKNAPINEQRRQYFHRCVLMASLSIIPISMQLLFYLLLTLEGV